MNTEQYLVLFPGASREKPRLMALAEAVLQQAVDLMTLIDSIQSGFSFATAEGSQLDAIAETVGMNRELGMTDEAFRAYLLQKLKLWTWDGTNVNAPAVLPEGVTETDNQNGTVTVSPAGTRQDLLPVPAGVRMIT
ncbi:MAG: DUF2612 domain-containing protein [Clostridia bacterium]|nr:DUF2612 domain-containing protein [Clostridia bacterium]